MIFYLIHQQVSNLNNLYSYTNNFKIQISWINPDMQLKLIRIIFIQNKFLNKKIHQLFFLNENNFNQF